MRFKTILWTGAGLIFISSWTAPALGESLSRAQRECRLQHARELLGKYYKHSAARYGENVKKINSSVYRWVREHLPAKYEREYQKVAQTIIDESLRREFDPVFLISVVQGESSFNPHKVGQVGEVGLMQIRPTTAAWITKRYHLKFRGRRSLFDPATNIRIGAAYLDYLRDRFSSHAQLYLAAYNMGQNKVEDVLEKNIWPKDYPIHVMKTYVEFYSALKEEHEKRAADARENSKKIGSNRTARADQS